MYYVISILTTVLEQEEEALKKAKSDLFKNVIKDNILQIRWFNERFRKIKIWG